MPEYEKSATLAKPSLRDSRAQTLIKLLCNQVSDLTARLEQSEAWEYEEMQEIQKLRYELAQEQEKNAELLKRVQSLEQAQLGSFSMEEVEALKKAKVIVARRKKAK